MLAEIKTILYASDLGKNARKAFHMAVSIATKFDARVVFLHVLERPDENMMRRIELYVNKDDIATIHQQAVDRLRAEAESRINSFYEEEYSEGGQFPHGAPEIRIIEGNPARRILAVADEIDADLIVMGSHAHNPVGELVLGSVANKIAHETWRPVMLVPLDRTGAGG